MDAPEAAHGQAQNGEARDGGPRIHLLHMMLQMGILGKFWPADMAALGVRVCRWLRDELLENIDFVVLPGVGWSKAKQGKGHSWASECTADDIARGFKRMAHNTVSMTWRNQGPVATMLLLEGMGKASSELGTSLTLLDICGNSVGDKGAEELSRFLNNPGYLRHLDLGKNQISAAGMRGLATQLQHCTRLQHLCLNSNRLGNRGAQHLAAVLSTCTGLTRLGLAGNQVGDEGATRLSEVLTGCNELAHVDFRWNLIQADGAGKLAQVLSKCDAVNHFFLGGNQVGDMGAASLASALSRCMQLRSLGLDANTIQDDGAACIARAIQHCRALRHLGLGGNSIGSEGAARLVQALGTKPPPDVMVSDLRWNQIGAPGTSGLAAVVGERKVLSQVEFAEMREVSQAQHQGRGWHLDLSGNALGDDGAWRVAAVLGETRLSPYIILH